MLKNNNVGNILKEARKTNKLTQQDLANKYLCDRQLISNYERSISVPSAENFILLLDILNTSVLIENGEAKIMEVKNMNNSKKENRDLKMEYLNFNLEKILKEHYKQKELVKNECAEKYSNLIDLAESKGLEVYNGYGFTNDMWHMDFSREGVAFSISKDNKEIQVEVEKSSYLEIFDLEKFIEDIKDKFGEGVSKEIFKIIAFDTYTYGLGRDMFELFKNISRGVIDDINKISKLLPMTEDFSDIIFNQLKSENYIKKVYELTIQNNDTPISYLLDIHDEYQSNNLWIKLILDDYEEVYEPESFDK